MVLSIHGRVVLPPFVGGLKLVSGFLSWLLGPCRSGTAIAQHSCCELMTRRKTMILMLVAVIVWGFLLWGLIDLALFILKSPHTSDAA